jgi:hypothetical protein
MSLPRYVPLLSGAREPNLSSHVPGFVVLYRNQPVAEARLGLPEPLRFAEVLVRLFAAAVKAVGADGVMNVCTAPSAVPIELVASAQ